MRIPKKGLDAYRQCVYVINKVTNNTNVAQEVQIMILLFPLMSLHNCSIQQVILIIGICICHTGNIVHDDTH